jgi:hypothetical protein
VLLDQQLVLLQELVLLLVPLDQLLELLLLV